MYQRWLLRCDAMLPGTARRLVTEATTELHRDVVETALLLTSELVTNAVRYGQAQSVSLCVTLTDGQLWVEVDDNATTPPTRRLSDQQAERGRGLILVNALASHWGVKRRNRGKVVWFCLARKDSTGKVRPLAA
jgi:anti-sigma regulatory factor (Ser/Thr protein kinase)